MTPTPPKLLIWSVFPTHHQSAFFAALRERDVDLVVHYYSKVSGARLQLGWPDYDTLPPGERYVPANPEAASYRADWKRRIHVVPGYSSPFLISLATRLTIQGVHWVHWSEPSGQGRRSPARRAARRFYGWLVDRHALGALAIGDLARRDFAHWGIRDSKVRLLPYAVAPLAMPARHSGAADDAATTSMPRLLFLGSLEHRKGLDVLFEALLRLRQRYPAASLDVVGEGPLRASYQGLVQTAGLAGAVRFHGPLPAARVGEALAACDVLVLPTRFDGWGMVLNEGAAAARALVSTETCGAAHHLIRPGHNGFRVPAGDPEALAQALSNYFEDPALAHRHGLQSARLFEDFTPARNADRLLGILREFTAYPGSGADARRAARVSAS